MKRPTRKPQVVTGESDLIKPERQYTSFDLRQIADDMDEQNVRWVELHHDHPYCFYFCKARRLESDEEAEQRYTREEAAYDEHKAKQADRERRRREQILTKKNLFDWELRARSELDKLK